MFWCHFLCVQLLTRWSRSVQQQTTWYIHFDRYRLALNFYRATRMHSADYTVARSMSVCPSHTHIFKVFSPLGSPRHSSFSVPNGMAIFWRGPPNEMQGRYEKISNDLEWLSKIFNDTKRCAVSLRQLSFLFVRGMTKASEDCVCVR